jgi:hypothetical protein
MVAEASAWWTCGFQPHLAADALAGLANAAIRPMFFVGALVATYSAKAGSEKWNAAPSPGLPSAHISPP